MALEKWQLGLIIGLSVVGLLAIIVVVRRCCCRPSADDGERKPLLAGDSKSSTAAALRFDKHLGADPPGAAAGAAEGGPLDSDTLKRITNWIDDVERARRGDGLAPLTVSHSDAPQLLGDTPDFAGVATPRTPASLSPRMSGVDVGGESSTSGVFLGYSPKLQ